MIRPLILLAATVILTFPLLALGAPLSAYYLPADGDDYAPALERAQVATGAQVELEARAYPLARAVDVCSPLRIVGQGTGYIPAASTFVAKGTAFRTWQRGTCPNKALPVANGDLALEHVVITYAGPPPTAPVFGIEARRRIDLLDVHVAGFTQGIRAVCDTNAKPPSNCNGSKLYGVDVIGSAHAGVFFAGGDANVITITSGRADKNCTAEAKWRDVVGPASVGFCGKNPTHPTCTQDHFRCAGYQDLSFLGNSYTGTMAATNGGHAGYVIAGPNNAGTLVGVYAEHDTNPQWADARATVLGGLNVFQGLAGQQHGMAAPGLVLGNGLLLGTATRRQGAAFAIHGSGDSATWPWVFGTGSSGQLELRIDARVVGVQPHTRLP